MRTAYTLEPPPARRRSDVDPWLGAAAWVVAFAILLFVAPCATERPRGGARPEARRDAISAPRGDAPRPR
ncbi:MAG TPA: hypothetical protein VFL83_13385 [Anaeromyxobacter sp.]|nr:hypothetical protein [Anaeromyxobacter sp.]